jgi:hypothetical protein
MGNKNFPNVNLILFICQLIVYLTIYLPISRKKVSLYEKNVKKCVNFILTVPVFFCNQLYCNCQTVQET